MKDPEVILCFALSKNNIYKPFGVQFKPSKEDQEGFFKLLAEADATLMGADTLRENAETMKKNKRDGLLRFGLTHHPEEFLQIVEPGFLEVANMSAKDAVNHLIERGKRKIVVLSGGPANDLLRSDKNLLTGAQITVEPVIFENGLKLEGWMEKFGQPLPNYPMKLNDQKTLLYKFGRI